MFFNIGGGEILVIAMVALIAVGPEQLPGLLRKIGRFLGQARSVTSNLRDEFMSGIDEVNELADPKKWMGSGSEDDPVVPRGYAEQQTATNPNQRRSSDPAGKVDGENKPAVNEVAAANAMRAEETVDESSASIDDQEPAYDEPLADEPPNDEPPADEPPNDDELADDASLADEEPAEDSA